MEKKPFLEQLMKILSQTSKYYEVLIKINVFYIEKTSSHLN